MAEEESDGCEESRETGDREITKAEDEDEGEDEAEEDDEDEGDGANDGMKRGKGGHEGIRRMVVCGIRRRGGRIFGFIS